MAGELTIRQARSDDRLSVERICAQTFDWGDYIPEVWDDWLDRVIWIGFADGQPEAIADLALAIRVHAAQIGAQKVRIMLPDLGWLRDAFGAAGYGFGDWEGELWIFERWLTRNGKGNRGG
jgi:hypothetical protein